MRSPGQLPHTVGWDCVGGGLRGQAMYAEAGMGQRSTSQTPVLLLEKDGVPEGGRTRLLLLLWSRQ